jgi:hypothetical protein
MQEPGARLILAGLFFAILRKATSQPKLKIAFNAQAEKFSLSATRCTENL